MTRGKIELLQEGLAGLKLAAGYLDYSMARCLNLIGQEQLPPEQLERLESLTSRFARLAAVPKVMAYAGNIIQRYPA